MLNIFLAALSGMCAVGQSAFTKASSEKTNSPMRFNTFKVGIAFLLFLPISFYNMNMHFHIPTLLFGACYGLSLFCSTLFGYLALKNGPMALTSLIVSYSVIIPCFYGIVFLNESVDFFQIIGFLLLLVSMYLLKWQADKIKLNKSWFLYIIITFFCNGICSVIQKLHQTIYPSSYCNEFMIYSMFITFALFMVLSVLKKENKNTNSAKYAIASGMLMGIGNYITLILSSNVNASILFPITSIFSMLFNVIISKLYFKDTFNILQLAGIGLGVISVLLIK